MKNLFKRRGFIAMGIAVFLIGGFFVSSVFASSTYNGNIEGLVGADGLNVSGGTTGIFKTTIKGNLNGGVKGQWATFIGQISGDINGNITGKINWNGADTLFCEVTDSGAVGHVYLIGQFEGDLGHFTGRFVTQIDPIDFTTEIIISGDNSVMAGDSIQLNATTNGSSQEVAWSVYVNDEEKASIDKNTGELTGLKEGSVTVIASALDGSLVTKNYSVTILPDSKAPIATASQSGQTITYTFDEPVQLLDADNTTVLTDYTGVFAIYEKKAYLAHQKGETEPVHIDADTAVLSGDAKSIIITYSGSLINQADTSYVVDAWGKNITDLVGNKMAATESAFFTVAGDSIAPTITLSTYDSITPAKTITVTASTNEGTLNATSHTFTTNSSFDFVATDAVGNISTSTVTINNIVDENQTVPADNGEVTISSSTPEVVVSSLAQPLVITVSSGTTNATVNFDSLISSGSGAIPQTTINSALATIEIPASTITSADTTWNGLLMAPKLTTVELPKTSGQTKSLTSAIEVGFAGAKLSFDKAVKITMPGQAGKRAGYTRTGEGFTEITNICSANDQATGDALAANSECKIDSGSDLVIWTKHFTTFATYVQTNNPSSGGGASVSYCSTVTYGDWGTNINGFQYRDILTQSPAYCSLTVSQQLAKSRTYVAEVIEPIVIVPVETVATSTTPVKQVLGEKKYADGTLLKGTNNRIYVVKDNALIYIPNLKELAKYRGPILKVGDDVIASFSKTAVLGAKKYTDGTLVKAKGDTKIYVIKDGKKVHIKSLAELRTYKGKTLTVEAGELSNY